MLANDEAKVQEVLDALDKRICIYCEKKNPPLVGLFDYSSVCNTHLLQAKEIRVVHGLTNLDEEIARRGLLVQTITSVE